MAESFDAMYFDVDQIMTEEEVAELYHDYAETMQDLGMDEYDSEDDIMQGTQGEDQGQQNTKDTQAEVGFQEMEQPIHHGTQQRQGKQLIMKQRREIVDSMLVNMQQGNLPRGHLKHLSVNFNVHKSTITRIFADIKKQMAQGSLIDVRTKKFGKVGRNPKEYSDEFLQSVPMHLRKTERSYAAALKISHVTLHNLKKKGRLRTHTSTNKPALTLEHKVARHQNVNREVIRDMLVTNVIPAIISKWPDFLPKNIVLRWDNARPHQVPTDAEFMAATTAHGFNIQFVFQQAQSPDLNVLDLGLFRSIQSLQYQSFPNNLDELVTKMQEFYEAFNPQVNKYIWLSLQKCMIEILKVEGENKYKIPHMNKKKLENLGELPDHIPVQKEIVLDVVENLNTMFRPVNQGTGQGTEDFQEMQTEGLITAKEKHMDCHT